jgi:hypothetical protein
VSLEIEEIEIEEIEIQEIEALLKTLTKLYLLQRKQ